MKIQAEINFQNRNYLIVRVRAGIYECIEGMSNRFSTRINLLFIGISNKGDTFIRNELNKISFSSLIQ